MKITLRSATSTQGRKMAGARSLWRANGMSESQFGKPIIAVVNSFTQFVPGHAHLHEIGQEVKRYIEAQGCFAAEFNTIAIDDGIVMYSGQEIGGYGNLIVLAHRKGYFSIYAHALKNFVSKGQRVHRGQVVALVGMTGRSTGPHLHFEVRRNSESYDPEEFVSAKKP